MRFSLLALCLFVPGAALADCAGETVLSCPIGPKRLEVCLSAGDLLYRFGPSGAPELALSVPLVRADFRPWPGVGSAIWDELAFHNAGIDYVVWTAIERHDGAVRRAGVSVMQGGRELAMLECDPGRVTGDLGVLYDAKEAAGQCFDLGDRRWKAACTDG